MTAKARWAVGAILAVYGVMAAWIWSRSGGGATDRPTTIRVAHWQTEMGPGDGFAAVIRRYEELNPGVRVVQMIIPPRVYRQWLRSNLAGDKAPEIVEFGVWLEGMTDVPVRYFESLNHHLAKPNPYNRGTVLATEPWLKTFEDELYEQKLNSPEPGQYYAITLTRSSLRLFCNRDLLRAVTGSEAAPRTLEELRGVARQLAEFNRSSGGEARLLAGSADNAIAMMNLYIAGSTTRLSRDLDREGLLALYPRQVSWRYLTGEWSFRHPAMRAALELVAEIHAQMKPGYQQVGRDEAMREFMRGAAVFFFAGTWEATSLRRLAGFPVDVFRCPQTTADDPVVGPHVLGPFADGNNMTGFGLYLNKRSSAKAAAVDFMQFLTSREGNELFARHSGWAPSVREVPITDDIRAFLTPEDGYSYVAPYLSAGGNARALFRRNLHLLAGPAGGVDRLAAGLDAGMREAAMADLEAERKVAWLATLPLDARIAAAGARLRLGGSDSDDDAATRSRLEAAQNESEARALLIAAQLRMATPLNRALAEP